MVASYYAWDPEFDCITKETDAAGAVTARYTQEPKLYGGLISQHRSGASSFYHYDAVGTTRALTDSSQTVTDTAVYTAFGEKVASVGSTTNPFGFIGYSGYRTNASSGGVYVRFRSYYPSIARWLGVDSLPLFAQLETYIYSRNLPASRIDPTGNLSQKEIRRWVGLFRSAGFPIGIGDPCAGHGAEFEWILGENEKDGIILQHVSHQRLIATQCRNGRGSNPALPPAGFGNPRGRTCDADGTPSYFELWIVHNGVIYIGGDFRESYNIYSRAIFAQWGYAALTHNKRKPAWRKSGSAVFIPFDEPGLLENLAKFGFDPWGDGVTWAGDLISTCSTPGLLEWFRQLKAKYRDSISNKSTTYTWDCCKECVAFKQTLVVRIDGAVAKEPEMD